MIEGTMGRKRVKARRKKTPPQYFTLTPEAVASVAPLSKDFVDTDQLLRSLKSQEAVEEQERAANLKKSLNGLKVVNELYFSKCSISEHEKVLQLWKSIRESGSAELVPAGEVLDTITTYLSSTSEPGVGDTGNAVWSYGCGPTEFNLKWVVHVGVSGLLTSWLTVKAAWNDLPRVGDLNIGDLVVAESDIDSNWYRAKILGILPNGVVKCKFIDYGNVEYNFPDRLRAVPDELSQIPELVFEASLAGLSAAAEEIDGEDVYNFLVAVKSTTHFSCTLVASKDGKYEVNLASETDTGFNTAVKYAQYVYENDDEPAYPYNPDHPLEKELPLLRFRNEELILPSRPEMEIHKLIKVRIREAVDPSELYVQILESRISEDERNLERNMNSYYGSPEENSSMEIRTERLLQGRVYAWRNPDTGMWERVEVKRVTTPHLTALVRRLDFGNSVLAHKTDMREMTPSFCHTPPLVEAAHLIHVRPLDGRNYWTAEEVLYFKRLIKLGTVFEAFVLSAKTESYDSLQRWNSLGLILFFHDGKQSVSLQSVLVGEGLAIGSGVSAGSPFLPKVGASHLFKSDVLVGSARKSNGYNTFWGPGLIEKEEDYSSARELSTSVLCLDEILQSGLATMVVQDWQTRRIPLSIRRRLGWVNISHVMGPGHFYIQMEHTLPYLSHLMTKLADCVSGTSLLLESDVSKGMFVSALVHHDSVNHTSLPPTWNRAFVLSYNAQSKHAEVILIDFGTTMFIHISMLRRLPKDYLKVPAFCARCHLADPNLVPIFPPKWSSEVDPEFAKYIRDIRARFPVYIAYAVSKPFKHDLKSYNQEMIYDSEEKAWVPDPDCCNDSTDWMKSFKSDVLLKHFFQSSGICVDYEEPDSGTWHSIFVPISDRLKGYYVKRKVQRKPPM